jgi:uncharacterized protein involved in response to NO
MQVFEKNRALAREPIQPGPSPPELQLVPAADQERHLGAWLWLTLRFVGALSLLAVGAVHLQQYFKLFYSVPTVGTLFVLNFVGATAIGLGLLSPVERLLGRYGNAALVLLTIGAIGLALTTFAFLLVSERTPLFGYQEFGIYPAAIMTSKVSELVTAGLLGIYSIARFSRRTAVARW